MSIIKETDNEYVAHTYGRFPVAITHGKGEYLYDDEGKEYIDFGSGIAVSTFGAADEEWVEAVCRQAKAVAHTSNLYYTEPCALLAKKLCQRTGMKKVFFSNSGAEANECAIKCARRWAFGKYGDESHSGIITLKNSFHGRTLATLSATGQDTFHTEFGPFPTGFYYADPDIQGDLTKIAKENGVCAVMFECVRGEGGVMPLSDEFAEEIKAVCQENDLLMIIDEVQTGNGRTGSLFCYEQYGFTPDIVSTAKGLAGGLPLGATMFGERTAEVYTPGSHGSTFGGNPVCAAAANSIIDRLTDELFASVKAKSEKIISALSGADGVKGISGKGLMLGILTEKPAKDVVAAAREKGLLLLTAKDRVRLLPPLNISDQALEKGIEILKEVIK